MGKIEKMALFLRRLGFSGSQDRLEALARELVEKGVRDASDIR